MAATSQKQAQIGAIKDISTSMSCSFSQPLFLQKPEMCLYNPTQLYLQEENKKILSVLNFLHHIPQVFSESSMYSEWFEGNLKIKRDLPVS